MAQRVMLSFDPIAEARKRWEEHGWADAAPAMALMTSVVRVQQVFVNKIENELKPLGLSMARYEVLMLLLFSRQGQLPLGKLSSRLQVQPGAITNAIDRLEADGLVTRRAHPVDGRTTLAKITPKGRDRVRKGVELLNERVYCAVDLSPESINQLFELLREVRCQAGDFPRESTAMEDSVNQNGALAQDKQDL